MSAGSPWQAGRCRDEAETEPSLARPSNQLSHNALSQQPYSIATTEVLGLPSYPKTSETDHFKFDTQLDHDK